MNPESFVAIVLALQFAAFGWRLNREIAVSDQNRKTWFPISDYINIIMIFMTAFSCVVLPLLFAEFGSLSRSILAAAVVFIAFHPLSIAGHYGLVTQRGRDYYLKPDGDYQFITSEELVLTALSIVVALIVFAFVHITT